MKNIFFLLAIAGLFHLVSCSTSGKTTKDEGPAGMKQKQFSSEQIQADALAMADVSCEWEVAKYHAALQENNRKLKQEEKRLYELKFALEQKMNIRYMQIEDLKKKFNKELAKARKQLTACGEWDVIQEMEEEREKAKKERENQ